jgi:hypothetical protein
LRRTRQISAIGVSLWSAVVASEQATSPTELSAELRAHFARERIGIVTAVRGLPLGVRGELHTFTGTPSLDIADVDDKFQGTSGGGNSSLPIRRLVAAGCSQDHCLVYYERAGVTHTWHVALFHWTPEATKLEWGGPAPAGLTTIEDVRRRVLSGAIRGRTGSW